MYYIVGVIKEKEIMFSNDTKISNDVFSIDRNSIDMFIALQVLLIALEAVWNKLRMKRICL